jgi:peptidoglycan pentaglycine glycine transferase (the first glycine)
MEEHSWNALIADLPGAHVLQTSQWGEFKASYGWETFPIVWLAGQPGYLLLGEAGKGAFPSTPPIAAALVLSRTVRLAGISLRVLYVPKGPLLDWGNGELYLRVLSDLAAFARQKQAILLKIDPDLTLGVGVPEKDESLGDTRTRSILAGMQSAGWRYSDEQIQFKNTVLINLDGTEDELLARMKQKTRYNIRLAERKGVRVRIGTVADLGLLYQMYAETSVRDGFVIRDDAYYRLLWEKFIQAGLAEAVIADVDEKPVAGLILFTFAGRAWYLYGMSRQAHREKMPNYLLQWEAIRRAKQKDCRTYDLWGAPDTFDESDALWGVYRFKEGLGGQVVRWVGAWDLPLRPQFYRLYTQVLPRILDLMRWRGRERTRRQISM